MTTPTFTWVPRRQAAGETTFRVRAAQFGDGYRQVAADGINNRVQSWQLTFNGRRQRIADIAAFLDARAGHERFYWTPPLASTPRLFTAGAYSLQAEGGELFTLTVTFAEAFQP